MLRLRTWSTTPLNGEGAGYRQNIFYKVSREEYLRLAFATAVEINQSVKLYYYDENAIKRFASVKKKSASRLINMLRDAGLRVDGRRTLEEIMGGTCKREWQKVAFTELDVRKTILVNETSREWQKDGYQKVAKACVKVKECAGITL
ncbi:uncharacterized protein B0T23DRAFT_435194 [Neurospora hispaniola]|uniref:GH10 domain-containing protein n=1 Tax=Neurospora hispaniola TaxID=588809 RepID=A0AAJ0MW30_9PEZI|nr:hypothetical protein B0T23DRAFT_435194 [Neurospora hispaniola]